MTKNFFPFPPDYKISFGPEIFLKILYLNSSLKLCCLSKIVCILTKLLSVRELGFAVWLREVCTFHRQCLLQISYDIKLPCSSPTMACPGFITSIREMVYGRNVILNLLHKMLRLLRNGEKRPYCR